MGIVSNSNDLPLERGDVEGVPFIKFFLFSSLPVPLGPMARAKKPSKAGQKPKKGFFWRSGPLPASPAPQERRLSRPPREVWKSSFGLLMTQAMMA